MSPSHTSSRSVEKHSAAVLRAELRALASPERARASVWFFKTQPGQYGYGDKFLGVTVPAQRKLAARFRGLSLAQVLKVLQSPCHEERLTALLILVAQFERAKEEPDRRAIAEAYLSHLEWVNNWDLVDSSARQILGAWLSGRDRSLLYRLAKSPVLWERRVAIISCHHFIARGESEDALKILTLLVADQHDLIHKACGWTLRELGKRVSTAVLREFLKRHAATMPRTMLRYAIEHLSKAERQRWMQSAIAPRLRARQHTKKAI